MDDVQYDSESNRVVVWERNHHCSGCSEISALLEEARKHCFEHGGGQLHVFGRYEDVNGPGVRYLFVMPTKIS